MTLIRNQFIKINLLFENGTALPVVIACKGMEKVPDMIEKNRNVYERSQGMLARLPGPLKITGFKVLETKPSVHLSKEDYETEVSFCDMVED